MLPLAPVWWRRSREGSPRGKSEEGGLGGDEGVSPRGGTEPRDGGRGRTPTRQVDPDLVDLTYRSCGQGGGGQGGVVCVHVGPRLTGRYLRSGRGFQDSLGCNESVPGSGTLDSGGAGSRYNDRLVSLCTDRVWSWGSPDAERDSDVGYGRMVSGLHRGVLSTTSGLEVPLSQSSVPKPSTIPTLPPWEFLPYAGGPSSRTVSGGVSRVVLPRRFSVFSPGVDCGLDGPGTGPTSRRSCHS